MKSAIAISRRKFLLLSGGIAGFLVAAPDLTWPGLIWQDRGKALHSRLIALFHHQHSARVIGQTYLQRCPQDADVRVLLKKVVADTVRSAASSDVSSGSPADSAHRLRSASDRDLMDLLQRRIRQDFTEEKVVKLQGWILSATEARLCALTALA
jgi:hypothetical protein